MRLPGNLFTLLRISILMALFKTPLQGRVVPLLGPLPLQLLTGLGATCLPLTLQHLPGLGATCLPLTLQHPPGPGASRLPLILQPRPTGPDPPWGLGLSPDLPMQLHPGENPDSSPR